MSDAAAYDELSRHFHYAASAVEPNFLSKGSGLLTASLLITAFVSLAVAFLNRKASSPVTYAFFALIASLCIGVGSIQTANYVGVYI